MRAIHPAISAAAKRVQSRGWRITSILRPGSDTHANGLAFDAAPWTYANRGFGYRTASAILREANAASPRHRFLAVSEGDHVHVELLDPSQPAPDYVGVTDKLKLTGLRVRSATMSDGNVILDADELTGGLPGGPIGDPLEEGELDFDPYGDPFDGTEQGGIFRRGKKKKGRAKPQTLARIAQASRSPDPAIAARANQSISAISRDPAARQQLANVAAVRAATKRITPPFVYIKRGASLLSSSLGPNARLRDADTSAMIAEIMTAEPFNPQVFPFAVVGANLVMNMDSVLNPANGGPLATGIAYKWVGTFIDISASVFNKEPARAFSVQVITGAGETELHTFRMERGVDAACFLVTNGRLSGGAPRLLSRLVTSVVVPTGLRQLVISGLNVANYGATGRFLVPGDKEVEAFLQQVAV